MPRALVKAQDVTVLYYALLSGAALALTLSGAAWAVVAAAKLVKS